VSDNIRRRPSYGRRPPSDVQIVKESSSNKTGKNIDSVKLTTFLSENVATVVIHASLYMAAYDIKTLLADKKEKFQTEYDGIVDDLSKDDDKRCNDILDEMDDLLLRMDQQDKTAEEVARKTSWFDAPSLDSILHPVHTVKHRPTKTIKRCDVCKKGILMQKEDGYSCQECHAFVRAIQPKTAVSKGTAPDVRGKKDFDLQLDCIDATVTLPRKVAPEIMMTRISDALENLGYDMKQFKKVGDKVIAPEIIPLSAMRAAFREVGLAGSYAYCVAVRKRLTGWGPRPIPEARKKIFRDIHNFILEGYKKCREEGKMQNRKIAQIVILFIINLFPDAEEYNDIILHCIDQKTDTTMTDAYSILNSIMDESTAKQREEWGISGK
jgi:hypothetical protein